MAKSVRIWAKKQLRLDHLTIRQRDMVTIGSAGLLSVFQRLSAAQGPDDSPALPLGKRYAIYKSKLHKGNRRDLKLTGKMLSNLKLRTMTDNSAKAALTSRKERIKGEANMRRQAWLIFSPRNRQAVREMARKIFVKTTKALVVAKATWGDIEL